MFRPTVGLDLGSAYTKVAIRPAFPSGDRTKYAEVDTDVFCSDRSALIPSIVIATGDRQRPWICGPDAARLTPGPNWTVFRNWKSTLFSDRFATNRSTLAPVASAFFAWLLGKLRSAGVAVAPNWRVRLSIPAIAAFAEQQSFLGGILAEVGWPRQIDFPQEPVANAGGLFSEGRNCVTGRGRMSYRPMFGSHDSRADRVMNAVFDQARRFLVDGSRHDRYLTVAVVDCGGFTLDLAKLVLDLKVTDYAELPFDVVTSHSYDVGISTAIDDRCLGPILRRHGVGIDSLSFEALEIAKYEVLAGREHNLFHQAKILALGRAEEDRKAVAQGLRSYCSEAWRFLARTEWDDVEYAFLTGGGVNIGKVREYLTQSLEEAGVGSVTCLHGGGAGRDAIASAGDYLRSAEAADDFGRLGTAVGDASIALGFDTRAA